MIKYEAHTLFALIITEKNIFLMNELYIFHDSLLNLRKTAVLIMTFSYVQLV